MRFLAIEPSRSVRLDGSRARRPSDALSPSAMASQVALACAPRACLPATSCSHSTTRSWILRTTESMTDLLSASPRARPAASCCCLLHAAGLAVRPRSARGRVSAVGVLALVDAHDGPQKPQDAPSLALLPPGSLVSGGAHGVLDGHRAVLDGLTNAAQLGEAERAADDRFEDGQRLAGFGAPLIATFSRG